MIETANQTRNYAELAGRTQPVVGDVVMAMVNTGMSFKDLDVRILASQAESKVLIQLSFLEIRDERRKTNSKEHEPKQRIEPTSDPSSWIETFKPASYSKLSAVSARSSRLCSHSHLQTTRN